MTQSNVNKLANIISKDLVTPNNTDNRIGIVSSIPGSTLSVGGTVIADKFLLSDGSEVGGAGGIGTALSAQGPGKDIFYIDKTLGIGQTVTIDIPNSASAAYILNQEISVTNDADVIVADGDDFILDVLGLSTEGTSSGPLPGTGGRLRVGQITGPTGVDAPTFTNGLVSSGVITATSGAFSGNVSIGGTLTYEDVTNIDSIGIITARSGVKVPDAQKILLGTGDDLEIYHSGSHSFIVDSGVGSLYIRSSGGNIQDQGNSNQSWLQFNSGAGVEAHFAGNKKLETTTGGVSITGTLDTSSTATFSGGLVEKYENAGTTLGAQSANPLSDGNLILFTGNESGTLTINFTGVHAKLTAGETCSFTVFLTPNNSGYISTVNVDGQTNIPIQWAGGAPTSGGSSGRDVYSFQIVKTGASTTDYLIFGAVSNYS